MFAALVWLSNNPSVFLAIVKTADRHGCQRTLVYFLAIVKTADRLQAAAFAIVASTFTASFRAWCSGDATAVGDEVRWLVH